MATKAGKFVPSALQRAVSIVHRLADIQRDVVALKEDFDAFGGASMEGLAEYDWAGHALVAADFTAGMAALESTINGVKLNEILSGKKLAPLVKIAVGA